MKEEIQNIIKIKPIMKKNNKNLEKVSNRMSGNKIWSLKLRT